VEGVQAWGRRVAMERSLTGPCWVWRLVSGAWGTTGMGTVEAWS
jgi:hypothetical protein